MRSARYAVVVVGLLLPLVARLVGWIVVGSSATKLLSELLAMAIASPLNALCIGGIVLASHGFRRPATILFPALPVFGVQAFYYSRLDLAADAQAGIALVLIPLYSLAAALAGWVLGLVFEFYSRALE